jgi:serine/threonine protein kinase
MREATIFAVALKKPPGERARYLEEACAGDAELRSRVEALLRSHQEAGSFLEQPAGEAAETLDAYPEAEPHDGDRATNAQLAPTSLAEGPGCRVGPYLLLEKLGEGGMGTVFLAEQHQPVVRQVALKLIKAGMDSALIIARFEQERQALALMDHPHIARVLDAGTTSTGRPYFVMELVKGIPLTQYCDQEHLTPKERLELFLPVCQAVQHAHQKGIIHRDLKPSNVLVTLYDGKPVPKVIDFGVAKATAQKLTEKTMFTEVGQLVGTLEYMAPEQAELNNLDIDVRADIYSLGVLLYELLTGSPPFTRKQLRNAAFTEMVRLIREVEPPKPSTRLSSSAELPSIAAKRKLEPKKLTRLVSGELDWIVMKALEKERHRRYETANGFALDIERYLHKEPVLAGPPNATYRLRKFLRRNKGPVLATSLFLLALVAGVVGTSLALVQAEEARQAEARQRLLAEAERDQKEQARLAAAANERCARDNERKAVKAAQQEKKAKDLAIQRLAQIEKANAILASIFQELDPRLGEKGGLPLSAQLGQRLDKATELLEGEVSGDALVVARLQSLLGTTQVHLGYPERGIVLLTKARATRVARLGSDHPGSLSSMGHLAQAYRAAGQLEKALPLFEETLAKSKARLGPDHPHTLIWMSDLAGTYEAAGKLDLALSLYRETLARQKAVHGPKHPNTLTTLNNLAGAYKAAGELNKAVPLYEEALTKRQAELGPDHLDTLSSMSNLAACYAASGRLDKALPLYEEALAKQKARFDPDHPITLTTLNGLAMGYQQAGQLEKALPLLEGVLVKTRARLGPDHPYTLSSMHNLATAYVTSGKLDQGLPLLEETVAKRKAKLGPEHPDTLRSMNNLAGTYWRTGKLNQSIPLFEKIFLLSRAKLGPDHPETLLNMANLGVNYRDAKRLDEALPLLEEAWERVQKNADPVPVYLTFLPAALAETYERAGQFARAEPLYRDLLKQAQKQSGAGVPRTLELLARLGLNLLQQKKYTDAEPLLRDCLKRCEKAQPDAWTTFDTRSLLGGALLGQKRYADAEPLLLAGYEGLKKREARIPASHRQRYLTEAVVRLVQLYDAWNKKDEAAKWRQQLPAKEKQP